MCNYNNKRHTFSSLMVNCSLQDTSTGTVNILQLRIALYIESNLIIHFNFTVRTKSYLTSAILGLSIYILLNILIIAPEALSFL